MIANMQVLSYFGALENMEHRRIMGSTWVTWFFVTLATLVYFRLDEKKMIKINYLDERE